MGKIFFKLIFLSVFLQGDTLVLIANKNLPFRTVSQTTVQNIYLGKIRFKDSVKLIPLNLPSDTLIRLDFEQKILHKDQASLRANWMRQHYLGRRPPHVLKSVQSILLFVQKVDGAIGYIPKNALDDTVKVIYEEARP